jgi:hypothetical protein
MLGVHAGRCAVTCPEPAEFCLGDHVRPHLDRCSPSGGKPGQYRARCPAHDDRKASMSIVVGDRARIVWHCHAGCPETDVRAALVRAGVPDGCLRPLRAQRTEDALVAALTTLLETERPGPRRDLLVAAVLWNGCRLPRGRDLVALGARAGLSRRAVYRVTASATSGTNATDTLRIASATSGTASANLALNVAASDLGKRPEFGASVVPGVDNSVAPEGLPARPLAVAPASVARCGWCDTELERRRPDTRYCSTSCRQKAHRARRKATAVPPGQFAASERETAR